jgi:hypothetical protein
MKSWFIMIHDHDLLRKTQWFMFFWVSCGWASQKKLEFPLPGFSMTVRLAGDNLGRKLLSMVEPKSGRNRLNFMGVYHESWMIGLWLNQWNIWVNDG